MADQFTSVQEMLDGVVAIKYAGEDIFGLWIGETFVWPDPWIDIWDEGTNVYWEDVWRNAWSEQFTAPVTEGQPNGNQ